MGTESWGIAGYCCGYCGGAACACFHCRADFRRGETMSCVSMDGGRVHFHAECYRTHEGKPPELDHLRQDEKTGQWQVFDQLKGPRGEWTDVSAEDAQRIWQRDRADKLPAPIASGTSEPSDADRATLIAGHAKEADANVGENNALGRAVWREAFGKLFELVKGEPAQGDSEPEQKRTERHTPADRVLAAATTIVDAIPPDDFPADPDDLVDLPWAFVLPLIHAVRAVQSQPPRGIPLEDCAALLCNQTPNLEPCPVPLADVRQAWNELPAIDRLGIMGALQTRDERFAIVWVWLWGPYPIPCDDDEQDEPTKEGNET